MVGQCLRVYPSAALLESAYPDAALLVFGHAQYGGREALLEVLDHLSLGVQAVQSVLVGTYPIQRIAAHEHTGDAGRPNDIAGSQFVAHIVETCCLGRMHIDTLLQQSQPGVAVAILADAIDLGRAQVHVATVVRIVRNGTRLRIVDGQSQPVVAYQNAIVMAHVER